MSGYSLLPGEKYGRLTVERFHERRERPNKRGTRLFWMCRCDCGGEHVAESANLRAGNVTQCASCTKADRLSGTRNRKHSHTGGGSPTKAYQTWIGMRSRCENPRNKRYSDYGGRGIGVDPSWMSFEAFLADMGDPPSPDHQLERVDNSAGYGPENCIWATRTEQGRNKRNSVVIKFNGEEKSLPDWCERLGLPYDRIKARLLKGWSAEDALTKPLRHSRVGNDYMTPMGRFTTIREAAEAYGMSVSGAYVRFRSPAFPEWKQIPR